MIDTPTGISPDKLTEENCRIPVVELCKIGKVRPTYYYAEARRGKAPKPNRGLTLAEAKAWLDARIAKKSARAEAVRRLHAHYQVPDAKEGQHE
jgi:hypothetical protein